MKTDGRLLPASVELYRGYLREKHPRSGSCLVLPGNRGTCPGKWRQNDAMMAMSRRDMPRSAAFADVI